MKLDIYAFWGGVSILFALGAYVGYFRACFRGEARPHLYSWLIWGTLASIGSTVGWRQGAGWGALVPTLMAVSNISICLWAWKKGTTKLTRLDTLLVILSAITLIIWGYTQNDLLAIIMVCSIDLIGFYFTWKKSYSAPYEEDIRAYVFWSCSFLTSYLAIGHHTLTNSLYSATLTIVEVAFVIFLLWRRKSHL